MTRRRSRLDVVVASVSVSLFDGDNENAVYTLEEADVLSRFDELIAGIHVTGRVEDDGAFGAQLQEMLRECPVVPLGVSNAVVSSVTTVVDKDIAPMAHKRNEQMETASMPASTPAVSTIPSPAPAVVSLSASPVTSAAGMTETGGRMSGISDATEERRAMMLSTPRKDSALESPASPVPAIKTSKPTRHIIPFSPLKKRGPRTIQVFRGSSYQGRRTVSRHQRAQALLTPESHAHGQDNRVDEALRPSTSYSHLTGEERLERVATIVKQALLDQKRTFSQCRQVFLTLDRTKKGWLHRSDFKLATRRLSLGLTSEDLADFVVFLNHVYRDNEERIENKATGGEPMQAIGQSLPVVVNAQSMRERNQGISYRAFLYVYFGSTSPTSDASQMSSNQTLASESLQHDQRRIYYHDTTQMAKENVYRRPMTAPDEILSKRSVAFGGRLKPKHSDRQQNSAENVPTRRRPQSTGFPGGWRPSRRGRGRHARIVSRHEFFKGSRAKSRPASFTRAEFDFSIMPDVARTHTMGAMTGSPKRVAKIFGDV